MSALNIDCSLDAQKATLLAYATLSDEGFNGNAKDSALTKPEAMEKLVDWVKRHPPGAHESSYGYKHRAENGRYFDKKGRERQGERADVGGYVSNGQIILAAIMCGYIPRPYGRARLNCTFFNPSNNWRKGQLYARAEQDIWYEHQMSVDEYLDSDLPVMFHWSHGANALRFARKWNLRHSDQPAPTMIRAFGEFISLDHTHRWSLTPERTQLITTEPYGDRFYYVGSEVPKEYMHAYLPNVFAHNEHTRMHAWWRADDIAITALITRIQEASK